MEVTFASLGGIDLYSKLKKNLRLDISTLPLGDRGSTVVKVLCYKSEGRWFDRSWC